MVVAVPRAPGGTGVRNPLKSLVMGPSLLINCCSKSIINNISECKLIILKLYVTNLAGRWLARLRITFRGACIIPNGGTSHVCMYHNIV